MKGRVVCARVFYRFIVSLYFGGIESSPMLMSGLLFQSYYDFAWDLSSILPVLFTWVGIEAKQWMGLVVDEIEEDTSMGRLIWVETGGCIAYLCDFFLVPKGGNF